MPLEDLSGCSYITCLCRLIDPIASPPGLQNLISIKNRCFIQVSWACEHKNMVLFFSVPKHMYTHGLYYTALGTVASSGFTVHQKSFALGCSKTGPISGFSQVQRVSLIAPWRHVISNEGPKTLEDNIKLHETTGVCRLITILYPCHNWGRGKKCK